MSTDYRWWVTEAEIPAAWHEAVKLAMHANGPDAQCPCGSGDEHQFMMDSVSDLAAYAMEALAPLVAQAERARLTAAETLHADPAVTCQHDVRGCTDDVPGCDAEVVQCAATSRYVVERSDGDQSFGWDGKHESCEVHLADVVTGMVNGDDVRAVVTIRWDAPDNKPEGD